MNRRRFLAGVGAAAAATTGYGAVRVADVRPYDSGVPAEDLGADPTPRERVLAAVRHLFEADHRSVTRVTVESDWTGAAPYRLTRHRELHEHSRRRHTHVLTTFGNGAVRLDRERDGVDARTISPYATINAYVHFVDATLADPATLPERFVFHVDDGRIAYDRDAPAQAVGDPVTVDGGYAGTAPADDFERPLFGEPVRPHRAPWTEHERADATVTYRLSGADAYARAVPLPFVPVETIHDDAAVRATLDRDSGREQWQFRPPKVTPPPAVRQYRSRFGDEPIAIEGASFSNWVGWLACRDGQVFVTGGTEQFPVLYAVQAQSGTMNWAVPGVSGQALLGDAVLFNNGPADYDAGLLDVTTGNILETTGTIGYNPTVYAGPDARKFTLEMDSYDWNMVSSESISDADIALGSSDVLTATITSSGLGLFEILTRSGDDLVVVDLRSGEYQSLQTDFEHSRPVVVTDDDHWFVCTEERVTAFPVVRPTEESLGTQLWQTSVSPVVTNPAITDTAVYVPTEQGLVVIDIHSGQKRSRIGRPPRTDQRWAIPPSIADGALYYVSGGRLTAYS